MKIATLSLGCLTVAALLIINPQRSLATLVSFQEGIGGYTGTEDTQLVPGGNVDKNFGSRPNFRVGVDVNENNGNLLPSRSLIRFDVTSLNTTFPGGFTVNSATLRLTGANNNSDAARSINLHLFADANVDWVEGTVNNTTQVGSSTWNRKQHAVPLSTAVKWAGLTPGAGVSGTDFNATVLASTLATTTTNADFDLVMSGDLSFINTWATGGTNAGFFLQYDNEAAVTSDSLSIFYSSEQTGAAFEVRRPELILDVTAVAVPEPTSFALLGIATSAMVVMGRHRRPNGFGS